MIQREGIKLGLKKCRTRKPLFEKKGEEEKNFLNNPSLMSRKIGQRKILAKSVLGPQQKNFLFSKIFFFGEKF